MGKKTGSMAINLQLSNGCNKIHNPSNPRNMEAQTGKDMAEITPFDTIISFINI